jgi:hypothetical protein
MVIGDSYGTITLPTSMGTFRVSGQIAGPYRNAQNQLCLGTVAQFFIVPNSREQDQEKVVYLVMPVGGIAAAEIEETFKAVAPHILKQSVESSDIPPVFDSRNNFVDVYAWLKGKQCDDVPFDELAAYLDGGKATHNRLCREDILRILLQRFETDGPFNLVAWDQLAGSPLKHRYYEAATVTTAIKMLLAEKKITGTRGGGRIVPDRADELRELVRKADEEYLAAPSAGGIFEAGKSHEAWQAMRGIIKGAQQYVWLEDAWLGSDVVALLGEDLPEGVVLRVLGPTTSNRHWNGALESLKRLGEDQSLKIEVRCTGDVHDRYLYVDNAVWRSSESFKDVAKKRTTRIVPEVESAGQLIAGFEVRWAAAQVVFSSPKGD